MRIEEVIKDVQQWNQAKKIEFEPLNGGYTNVTYKVNIDNNLYAIRINGHQNEFLKLKREEEIRAIEQAARLDLAPMVLDCKNKDDYLITEFLNGSILSKEEIHEPEIIKKVAEALRKVHSIKDIKRICSPYHLIRSYLEGAERLGVKIPIELGSYLERMTEIENSRKKDLENTNKYCHNDYFTFNMIKSDYENIKVIDWELSGIGDAYFDLATLSFSNSFNQAEEIILLRSYFGNYNHEMHSILSDLKLVCMIREISWALLHSGIEVEKVNHEMNYYQFALWVLDRLRQGFITL